MQEFGFTPLSEQFQALPAPTREPGHQQAPSSSQAEVFGPIKAAPSATEARTTSSLDEYINTKVAEAQAKVDFLRERGHPYSRNDTWVQGIHGEHHPMEPLVKKWVAGQEPTEEEYRQSWAAEYPDANLEALWEAHKMKDGGQRFRAVLEASPNRPLIRAEARLNSLKASRSGDYSAITEELHQDIAIQQGQLKRADQEGAKPRGTLEGDDLYFPLEEEIAEKERLQAQIPTPERKVIIDLLKGQLKKTKRGEAATTAKSSQEQLELLNKLLQSIPTPTTTK